MLVATLVAVTAFPLLARADLVSPGELSRAHEKLEGLQNCTKCHQAGQQFSAEKCLECHKELRASISAGKGFHGRSSEKKCETCHHEHQGRGFALVD
ncbi:MAG: cytochrome c3 family protein, partial [Deltaproteobacteria bacterium]